MAPFYGLKPEHLHRTFVYNGKTYEIVGFNHRARVNKVVTKEVASGREYVCPVDVVRSRMED